MERKKKILVFGHRNPDTDSIVSAIAYAELKQALGVANCLAARCGNVNLQTEYILERFGVPAPEFVAELIPKVKYYMSRGATTVPRDMPLWQALEILNKGNFKMIPIVDDGGHLLSILHFNAFAQNMLRKIDPNRKGVFPTSVSLLVKTLGAQPVTEFDSDTVFQAQIAVAAYEVEAFREHIDAMPPANTIVLVGNREDVQACVIERKVRVLIVTGGRAISRELKKKAGERGVSVLISPYDTSTTSWLALYSSPVEHTGDGALKPLRENDYIGAVRERILSSVSRSLPVVDAERHVLGVLSQSDLMREPDIEIILVDHNEISQAVDGAENYRILEIIDHHRLGNVHTNYPITFINKPVGSTSTIIATLYQDNRVPMRKEIASILLAGILSDTLILRSATTTEADRHMAEYLSDHHGSAHRGIRQRYHGGGLAGGPQARRRDPRARHEALRGGEKRLHGEPGGGDVADGNHGPPRRDPGRSGAPAGQDGEPVHGAHGDGHHGARQRPVREGGSGIYQPHPLPEARRERLHAEGDPLAQEAARSLPDGHDPEGSMNPLCVLRQGAVKGYC